MCKINLFFLSDDRSQLFLSGDSHYDPEIMFEDIGHFIGETDQYTHRFTSVIVPIHVFHEKFTTGKSYAIRKSKLWKNILRKSLVIYLLTRK